MLLLLMLDSNSGSSLRHLCLEGRGVSVADLRARGQRIHSRIARRAGKNRRVVWRRHGRCSHRSSCSGCRGGGSGSMHWQGTHANAYTNGCRCHSGRRHTGRERVRVSSSTSHRRGSHRHLLSVLSSGSCGHELLLLQLRLLQLLLLLRRGLLRMVNTTPHQSAGACCPRHWLCLRSCGCWVEHGVGDGSGWGTLRQGLWLRNWLTRLRDYSGRDASRRNGLLQPALGSHGRRLGPYCTGRRCLRQHLHLLLHRRCRGCSGRESRCNYGCARVR